MPTVASADRGQRPQNYTAMVDLTGIDQLEADAGPAGRLEAFVSPLIIHILLCTPSSDPHIVHVIVGIPHLSYLDILFHHQEP